MHALINFFGFFFLLGIADAQSAPKARALQMRAVLHDPVQPALKIFVCEPAAAFANPIELQQGTLSANQNTVAFDNTLYLYDSPDIDLTSPSTNSFAKVTVPANINKFILLIVKLPDTEKEPYRLEIINDTGNAFPWGTSKIISFVSVDTALEAGEQKILVKPGATITVPTVKKVDKFDVAQTNFYYKSGKNWQPFSERRIQFVDTYRRIFIIHITPKSKFLRVTTVLDSQIPSLN